ncbi:MAG: Methylthioribulose-1-phosphate dehydratase [Planctomycetes bacterium ADurb.Bin126]|nr:MAG: Methylthioribulose-1-phosphate dehydratase [Planctomycetes bacterium ADurb.Bin126]HOD80777.1 class II aldolase/adducin family protein [Phycisphaerae bacterium]HQL72068.1 class II aldolase/adducin family protein [Phycisphaerae bacterium]
MAMSEFEAKKEICDIGKRMWEKGFIAANDGNMTYRLGPNRFLCTPTGVSKGFLRPEDICTVDAAGKQIGGAKPRTSEIMLHLEIFHEMPHVNAVAHAHPPHATAFAVAGMEIPQNILPEVEIWIGHIPIAPYETPGGKQFAETILPHLRNKANTILLANHGAVSFGDTVEHAYFHLETIDMYCQILLLAKQIGKIQLISDPKVRELLEIKKKIGNQDPRLDCETCSLAGSDEFLRGFSTHPIPQHTVGPDGHGRGNGIAGMPSQCNEPQPMPKERKVFPAVVAGRALPLGSSSTTARKRQMEDESERMVQLITDKIVTMIGRG